MNNTKKVLHIAVDEKFIDNALQLFETTNYQQNIEHSLHIIKDNANLKYVTTKHTLHSICFFKSKEYQKEIAKYDAVIIHSMLLFIDDTHFLKNIPTLWIGWGFDYYDFICTDDELLMSKTKSLDNVKTFSLLTRLKNKFINYRVMQNKKRMYKNIDYFAPVLESEFDLIMRKNNDFKFKYIDFNYPIGIGEIGSKVTGNNILIGNSSTPTNNHIEVLNQLDKMKLNDRSIYLPLNYGNMEYKERLLNEVKKLNLYENTIVITEFLDPHSYLEVLCSCNVMIMNHIRQQGLGNINLALQVGMLVFLNEKSPVYTFFKSKGACLFTTQQLNEQPNLIDFQLTAEQKDKNQFIVENEFSQSTIQSKLNKLMTTLLKT